MEHGDDPAERFKRTMRHIESMLSWLDSPADDCTLIVDVPELETQLRIYRDRVSELLAIEPTPENRDQLASQIGILMAAADSVRMSCEVLPAQLDRLLEALCDDNGESSDSEGNDDS